MEQVRICVLPLSEGLGVVLTFHYLLPSVEGGVLISFSRMKSISYDSARDLVTLQPGIRWGEALDALEPFGVAVMGGRLP